MSSETEDKSPTSPGPSLHPMAPTLSSVQDVNARMAQLSKELADLAAQQVAAAAEAREQARAEREKADKALELLTLNSDQIEAVRAEFKADYDELAASAEKKQARARRLDRWFSVGLSSTFLLIGLAINKYGHEVVTLLGPILHRI